MSITQSNKKRIARNTILLYIRMLLSIMVSFYTSRVVLQMLGVEDYGIYGVVPGIMAMFSFLNSVMSGATSRHLTYEIGKVQEGINENDNLCYNPNSKNNQVSKLSFLTTNQELTPLQKIFSAAMIIHVGITLLFFFLAIIIGLWFLNNKLIISEGRMTAAYFVYVCSILGMFVNVTQVPYNAAIIAHE